MSDTVGGSEGPDAFAAPPDLAAPDAWPVTVEKTGRWRWPLFAGIFVIFGLFGNISELTSGIGLQAVLTQTTSGEILAGIVLVFGLAIIFALRPGRLTVDSSGIDVREGGAHWFYDWGDIESLDVVKAQDTRGRLIAGPSVRVSLKGRTAEQNQCNVISAGFVGSASALQRLLTLGREHFGGGGSGRRSIAPGDNLRALQMKSALVTAIGIGLPILFCIGITEQQASNARNMIYLQNHGRRGEAVLLRTFLSCGRGRGCSTRAQFRFQPEGSAQTFTNIDYLGTDKDDDPNVVYARTHNTLPIAYDPGNPSISALNLNDSAFTDQTERYTLVSHSMDLIALLILAPYVVIVGAVTVQALRTPRAQAPITPIVG